MITQSLLVVGGLSLAFGLGLAYFAKKFSVKIDPRVQHVRDVLPGINCGACGLAGCDAFAEAVVKEKVPIDGCIPGQQEVADKICQVLGKENNSKKQKKVAQLHCDGSKENCESKYSYEGISTCKAASLLQGGYKKCSYGCLGLADCVKVCPFDALHMQKNGLPKVDKEKCTACGNCVKECPKNLYDLVPAEKKIHVLCSSKDLGKVVTKLCKVGCIACGLCERACPVEGKAIHVIDNIAKIDYSKCIQCGKCVNACPRKIIVDERKAS